MNEEEETVEEQAPPVEEQVPTAIPMTQREMENHAAIWAILFLVSEFSLAFRTLRDKLHERGALLPEDEEEINKLSSQDERLKLAYQHTERAFREKFGRVMTAMVDPEGVERAMGNIPTPEATVDLNTVEVPTEPDTNPQGE